MTKPLRILDLTRVVAGPTCTQNLADMGAVVYKIERPTKGGDLGGDDTRKMGPFLTDPATGKPCNDSALFLAYNRGKHSVTVDIAKPEGAQIVRDLAAHCDVVVENYKVGDLQRYGLDYDTLSLGREDLIYCSITGWGQTGPMAPKMAYDFILQGFAGVMSTCGHPDDSALPGPLRTAIPITDVVTGLYATIAIQQALIERMSTGRGKHIDMAMLDCAVAMTGHLALGYLMSGREPKRAGNTNPIAAPSEVFAVADGHVIVAAGNDSQFKALCAVLGCSQLLDDPRFVSNAQRVGHARVLRDLLAPKVAPRRSGELLGALEAANVPCGPINNFEQVFQAPQVAHRGLHMSLPHARGVDTPSLKSPLTLSHAPSSAPMLGAHTDSVLQEVLGYSADKVAQLRGSGVI